MPELTAFWTVFSPALVMLRYWSDCIAPLLVLTLIPFIGWSPFWFVFASVLLAGRFALPVPFATAVPETDSELANFLLRGADGKHRPGQMCRAAQTPGRIYRPTAILAGRRGRNCRI
jgi:hypothetical protein